MWKRFTEQSRRALLVAQEQVVENEERIISTGSILLALFQLPDCSAAQLLRRQQIGVGAVIDALDEMGTETSDESSEGSLRLTKSARQALDCAAAAASQKSAAAIDTDHLLLGMMHAQESDAARALTGLGLDERSVWESIDDLGQASAASSTPAVVQSMVRSDQVTGAPPSPMGPRPGSSAVPVAEQVKGIAERIGLPLSRDAWRVFVRAADAALREGSSTLQVHHLLEGMKCLTEDAREPPAADE